MYAGCDIALYFSIEDACQENMLDNKGICIDV